MNNGSKEATIEKQCHQFLDTDSFNWIKVPLKKLQKSFLIPAVLLTPCTELSSSAVSTTLPSFCTCEYLRKSKPYLKIF